MRSTWAMAWLAALAVVSAAGCGPSMTTAGEPGEPGSASAELQGKWWTWAASEPEETNPVADEDGSVCDRNQPEDVWFLAGTFGGEVERACTVPEGRPIVFPLVNLFGSAQDCLAFLRDAEGTALLDGTPVEPVVYAGESITVQGLEGNAVTGEAGRFTTTGCGLWVRLPAPGPGQHILKFSGRSTGLSVGAEYRLTIEESSGQPSKEAAGQLPDEASGPAQVRRAPITDAAPVADAARLF
ncbi:signal protein [Streptomyces cyaneofuscatus]|uniref:signal protein n=1 Tax=Streptomyces cyaneofuscatus TaxID=66883 RepID=UPI0033B0C0D4